MKAPYIIILTNKSFENKLKRENESRGIWIPFLDISIMGFSGRFLPLFWPTFLYNSAFENESSD
jgi:hypothetical protein